jgi:hypothetical protein
MPIIASASSSANFKPCPSGVHDAVCAFVEDLGMEFNDQYQKEEHKVLIMWEVNEPMDDGRPYMISKKYTISLHEKAQLRKDLEGWRGTKFTEEQLKGFDVEVLKGKQCQLHIIHNEKNGKTYANIQAVLPKGKNSPAISVVAQEVPKWVNEQKKENAAAHAKRAAAASVTAAEPEDIPPRLPTPSAGNDEPPF